MTRLTDSFPGGRRALRAGVVACAAFIATHPAWSHDPPAAPPAPPIAPAAAAPALADEPAAPRARTHFDRVGLIGASATAGFGVQVRAIGTDGISNENHGADFGDVMQCVSLQPVVVSRYGSSFFFTDPLKTGRREVDRVLQFKPTCVFALDFLFWYGYGTFNAQGGRLASEDDRLALLEVGLAELDRVVQLGVPLIVGDFPDMHEAVGKMLSASQMPASRTLARLNERLRAWAEARPNVRVLALSTIAPALDRGDEVAIRGRTWCRAKDGALIQGDRLHPTFIGSIAMLAIACELAESCPLPADDSAGAARDAGAAGGTSGTGVAAGASAAAGARPKATSTGPTCAELFCFEPALVKDRFMDFVRSGRGRAKTIVTPKESASPPSAPSDAPAPTGAPAPADAPASSSR